MAASVNDKFSKVSTGARPTTTTVASIRSVSGTSLICDDLTGWDTDAAVHFSTYQVDGQGDVVAGTQTDMKGTVSGNTISNIVITGGTDTGNAVGDIVQQLPTARYAKDLADGLLVSHNQDGTLKSSAIPNGSVTTAKVDDDAVTPVKRSGGFKIGTMSTSVFGATGSKVITGLGFRPKFLRIFVSYDTSAAGAARESLGVTDGTTTQVRGSAVSGSSQARWAITSGATIVNIRTEANSTVLAASFTSFDADGFTINVTTADASYSGYYEAYA